MLQLSTETVIQNFINLCRLDALSCNEKAVADHAITLLQQLGLSPYTDSSAADTGSNTGNVICKVGTGGDFLLLSHMDTARSTKDVKIKQENGKISSDGNSILGSDDRAGMASILSAVQFAVNNKVPLKDFTIAFTVCEETTLGGSRFIQLPRELKKGFVFDSSYRPGKFICSSPGAKYIEILITGKASHSGISPEKGINAIAAAAAAISRLKQGRLDDETSMNLGTIQGGTATNVISESVIIKGEVRSFDKAKVESVTKNMNEVFIEECNRIGAVLDFHEHWDFEPYTHTENAEIYQDISRVITGCGLVSDPKVSFGGSDANSLNARGIHAVNIGIGAQNPHANDEFILVEDLLISTQIALSLITR